MLVGKILLIWCNWTNKDEPCCSIKTGFQFVHYFASKCLDTFRNVNWPFKKSLLTFFSRNGKVIFLWCFSWSLGTQIMDWLIWHLLNYGCYHFSRQFRENLDQNIQKEVRKCSSWSKCFEKWKGSYFRYRLPTQEGQASNPTISEFWPHSSSSEIWSRLKRWRILLCYSVLKSPYYEQSRRLEIYTHGCIFTPQKRIYFSPVSPWIIFQESKV